MIRFKGISFAPDFKARSESNFKSIQKNIDKAVLDFSQPYIPKASTKFGGRTIQSGSSSTKIGSGVVEYTNKKARTIYYTNKGKGKEGMNANGSRGLRGPYSFERMKADHKDDILKGAMSNGNG